MKTVCVDFDGVLAKYDHWQGIEHIGSPLPGAREFLNGLRERGVEFIIILTARTWTHELSGETRDSIKAHDLVYEWLERHEMPFDMIQAKPIACAYVDDRAVAVQQNPQSYEQVMADVERLLGSEK